jgi:hypothetical protein
VNIPAKETLANVNATTRFLQDFGNRVAFYAVETDSMLAPLLIWDVAHALPIGGTLIFAGDDGLTPYATREYYREAFKIQSQTSQVTILEKIGPLPAEKDKGLKRWTFGIPTGPGDATGLNACVQRILELGFEEFEIVLCGRPGPSFKYFDKVRIVGEEYSKPPVMIGLKKNIIAENAKYENLCIIHDRVFLPLDFKEAIEKFGDLYSLNTMQSIWIDDYNNLVIRRYSDYGVSFNAWSVNAVLKNKWSETPFSDDFYSIQEGCTIAYANALRYSHSNYCTGSMYICKKNVWQDSPQSNHLRWEEYEDLEQGLRASSRGVPSRVNPNTLTQTLSARVSVIDNHASFQFADGSIHQSIPLFSSIKNHRRPLLRISSTQAKENALQFARIRLNDDYLHNSSFFTSRPILNTRSWVELIGYLIYSAHFPYTKEGVESFIRDCEKYLLPSPFTVNERRRIIELFHIEGPGARCHLFENNYSIQKLLLFRPDNDLFLDKASDLFFTKTWRSQLGMRMSAAKLSRHNGNVFYNPGGYSGFRKAIQLSTPFSSYFTG